MTRFELNYELLDDTAPELGRAAIVPWDSEHFGFNVAAFQPIDRFTPPVTSSRPLQAALLDWIKRRDVELLSCNVPAISFQWMAHLAHLGFAFVDLALMAFARRLTDLPRMRVEVRRALPEDITPLETIAESAFRFGRYHADPRFPARLADQRYQRWIGSAVGAQSDTEFVLVSGPRGAPTGFVHAIISAGVADLRLAAVAEGANGGLLGPALFSEALRQLAAHGAHRAKARLSAGNTAVLNLYSSLGFSFGEAEAIYHLHAPAARHLLNPAR